MGRANGALKTAARTASKVVFSAADPFFGGFPGPRILIYHQVEAGLGRQMEVTKDAFIAQLEWLDQHGVIVDLDSAVAARGSAHAERRFVLTFDDGYDDFYRNGYPELVRRNMPFVLYLTTGPVETRRPLFPGGQAEPLTWDQVSDMAESGLMTLGAHTHTHLDVRAASRAEIEDEPPQRCPHSVAHRYRSPPTSPTHGAIGPGGRHAGAESLLHRHARDGQPNHRSHRPDALNRVAVQLSDGVFFFTRQDADWGCSYRPRSPPARRVPRAMTRIGESGGSAAELA